jgi:hypothetical protein
MINKEAQPEVALLQPPTTTPEMLVQLLQLQLQLLLTTPDTAQADQHLQSVEANPKAKNAADAKSGHQ